MPGTFQLISQMGDFGNVIRNRDRGTTGASKDCQVTGGRQVRTEHSLVANLQLDPEERVLDFGRCNPAPSFGHSRKSV